jgi:hypothetical protein
MSHDFDTQQLFLVEANLSGAHQKISDMRLVVNAALDWAEAQDTLDQLRLVDDTKLPFREKLAVVVASDHARRDIDNYALRLREAITTYPGVS